MNALGLSFLICKIGTVLFSIGCGNEIGFQLGAQLSQPCSIICPPSAGHPGNCNLLWVLQGSRVAA